VVHNGFNLGDGWEMGGEDPIVAIRAFSEMENHLSSWGGEGDNGGGALSRS